MLPGASKSCRTLVPSAEQRASLLLFVMVLSLAWQREPKYSQGSDLVLLTGAEISAVHPF